MAQYYWDNCPLITRSQVERLIQALRVVMNENMIGVYLHGSMAFGCFNPLHSDIDLMVITREPLTNEVRRSIGVYLLQISNSPTPLNMTLIAQDSLKEVSPVKFEFRFNEARRQLIKNDIINGRWHNWSQGQTDLYLVSYIKMVQVTGLVLFGEPIEDVFPDMPETVYRKALLSDFTTFVSSIEDKPVGSILNMLRVYRYLKTGDVVSKDAAGAWGIEATPEMADLIQSALVMYRGSLEKPDFDPERLRQFAALLNEKVSTVA